MIHNLKYKPTKNKDSLKSRYYRQYKRVLNMLKSDENNCLFLTFTFSDESMKKVNEINRLRAIETFLNKQCKEYVLNIDFGKETEREHYHALVIPRYKGLIYYKGYHLGYLKGEKVNQLKRFTKNNDSLKDIAKRLTEHTFKNSTRNYKIHYSRADKNKPIDKYYKMKIDELIKRNIETNQNKRKATYLKQNKGLNDIDTFTKEYFNF